MSAARASAPIGSPTSGSSSLPLSLGDFLAQILGILVELLGGILVGLLQPPGEVGLVAVVERVPPLQHFLQLVHGPRRAEGNRRGNRLAARLGQMLANLLDGARPDRRPWWPPPGRPRLPIAGGPFPNRGSSCGTAAAARSRPAASSPGPFRRASPALRSAAAGTRPSRADRARRNRTSPGVPAILAQPLLPIEIGFRGRQIEGPAEAGLVGLILAFQVEHRGPGRGGFTPVGRRQAGRRKEGASAAAGLQSEVGGSWCGSGEGDGRDLSILAYQDFLPLTARLLAPIIDRYNSKKPTPRVLSCLSPRETDAEPPMLASLHGPRCMQDMTL